MSYLPRARRLGTLFPTSDLEPVPTVAPSNSDLAIIVSPRGIPA